MGYSPMTNPHMTFIEAVAWIATGDSRFADTCRDRTHRGLAISLAIRKRDGEMQLLSIDSAEKALLAECRSGRITATGLRGDISRPTAKRRTRITDIEWIDIRERATEETRTGCLMLESNVGGEYWHKLTFTRADVLAEFPVGKPKSDGIARVIPKCPPMSQRTRYSLWQGITDEFPDGVPFTMTIPDVARQLTENAPMIARGIKKKDLMDGKHDTLLKRLLERTGK